MSEITITIPPEIVSALRLPPDGVESALHQELALALYMRGILSSGKAAALAGLKRWQWEELLVVRKVPPHYIEEDLHVDISYGSSD
ncbi:hypothetical protein RJ53_10005 [Methanocalculus chunghsingensis]|uniref:Uncharacterized protein n=1 Tax=Methanocalculus chunghsingensis TaxID=156457 RepID=A0A8J7W950_9EURY|nr:UPF0175 family protein [Methanocalculus chunghsingensis]MBR1369788.1 hypothetical protein [Methanocalculus chunghsingensis]